MVSITALSNQAKPHHDGDLYRLYGKAASQNEGQRGRRLRVVFDYELNKRLYHARTKLGKGRESDDGKQPIAQRHGHQVVRGRVPVSDVRIKLKFAMQNWVAWTFSFPPVTIAIAISPRKYAQDSRSAPRG